jgi:hypothetical protein
MNLVLLLHRKSIVTMICKEMKKEREEEREKKRGRSEEAYMERIS